MTWGFTESRDIVRRSAPEVLHLPRVRAAASAGAGLLVPNSVYSGSMEVARRYFQATGSFKTKVGLIALSSTFGEIRRKLPLTELS